MTTYGGGSNDDVTLQPGPRANQVYRCPTCGRVGWFPVTPMCKGTVREPHFPDEAVLVSRKQARLINPADSPLFY